MAERSTFPNIAPGRATSNSKLRSLTMTAVSAARREAALLVVTGVVLVLGVWHLDRYPQTWFDEGTYLEAAWNFADRGVYAQPSADGTLDYAPVIGVGPTVLIPAALVLKIGGHSLELTRLVPLIYMLIATGLLYVIGRSLFGRIAALLSILFVLALPALDWVATGRQVLGEVPALAFLLLGGALAVRSRSTAGLIASGVVLGLAMVTKGQYLLVLPAAVTAVALFDYLDTRQRQLRWYGVLLCSAFATYGLWIASLLLLMGGGKIVENFRLLRESSGGALVVFDLERMLSAWKFLLGPGTFLLVIPAAIFGLWAIRTTAGDRRLAITALWVFQIVWLGWFATASVAWPRYAFAGLAINAIFMGPLVCELITAVPAGIKRRFPAMPVSASAMSLLAGSVFILLILAGATREFRPILTADGRAPQEFAALVDRTVPAGQAVDGWEPEIGFLSERPMQYPPLGSLDRVVRATWFDQGGAPDLSTSLRTDYLVIGPFARWVGAYDSATAARRYTRIGGVGGYELFQRVDRAGFNDSSESGGT